MNSGITVLWSDWLVSTHNAPLSVHPTVGYKCLFQHAPVWHTLLFKQMLRLHIEFEEWITFLFDIFMQTQNRDC